MNMRQLFTWTLLQIVKSLRRKLIFVLSCALLLVIIVRWKLMCSNLEPLTHIKNLCDSYVGGQAVGNLCEDLCQPDGVPSLSCHNFYNENNAPFSGTWGNITVVFKSALKKSSATDPLHWLDASNNKIYPSENEFSNMIKKSVKVKFNMTISHIDAKRMSYTHYSISWPARHTEMENVWTLMQDNEYLLSLLYDKFNIFPKLIGSCGSLYAVEKLESISGFWHLMTLYDSHKEWVKRIKISLRILDLLANLEKELPEPLLICDVKMNNFGITNDLKKVMYLNLDSVHPLSVASQITGDRSRCKRHNDCDFLDCRSFCNLITFKCEHGVINNNLQIVCERIFLGWVMSGRVMVPGLLLGPHTPRVLIELLELCANPASENGTPRAPATKDVRKRLHNLLVHLALT